MPTVENFKALLCMNHTKLSSNGQRCKDSQSHLRARHVEPERKPKPVRKDLAEIPTEITEKHNDIELYMDTMFINKCRMLTVIERLIQF